MLEGLIIGAVLVVTAAFLIACRSGKRDANIDLRAPLLPAHAAGDHRVEAAIRDAELGFARCSVCAFENFRRFPFCSLCGQELEHPELEKRPQLAHKTVERALTQRQQRVKTRREWVRKLDVEGTLFWFRDTTSRTHTRAFCVTFASPETVPPALNTASLSGKQHDDDDNNTRSPDLQAPPPLVDIASDHDDEGDAKCKQAPQPRLLQLADVLHTLAESTRGLTVRLTEATASDPTQLPLGTAAIAAIASPVERLPWSRRLLASAAQDFPTKYAEFVALAEALIATGYNELLKLKVSRAFLLEDSLESLCVIPESHIRCAMRITFENERGLDAGGLHREWFVLLNEKLGAPASGVFTCVNMAEQSYYLNPRSENVLGSDHLLYCYGVGRLIGRALLEGQVLSFHLALPLLKILLGQPVSFTDLDYFDPEAYKNLLWIQDHAGVDTLGLTFSLTEILANGETIEVDLIEDGRNIDVTDENKDLYLDRRFRYLLFESVSSQLYAFLKGVYEVAPFELLARFDPEELDYVLCGSNEIDVDDWERSSQITESLSGTRNYLVRWFWELVRAMPNEYRRRLLHFATGSSRVPIAGFSALVSNDGRLCPFTLKFAEAETNGYIWSHACFNRLDLPLFRSKDRFKAVLYAILETERAGFTTD